jgi:hypothetical protein
MSYIDFKNLIDHCGQFIPIHTDNVEIEIMRGEFCAGEYIGKSSIRMCTPIENFLSLLNNTDSLNRIYEWLMVRPPKKFFMELRHWNPTYRGKRWAYPVESELSPNLKVKKLLRLITETKRAKFIAFMPVNKLEENIRSIVCDHMPRPYLGWDKFVSLYSPVSKSRLNHQQPAFFLNGLASALETIFNATDPSETTIPLFLEFFHRKVYQFN